jgi:hypothetical protein
MKYAEITNNKEFIQSWFRPISFNIDEAHNYFFSRSFEKNINVDNLMVSTQVRKRQILISFLTQELAQLDVFFRRLAWWKIKKYYSWLWFIRFWKLFYVPNPENTNLEDETEAQIKKRWVYLAPHFLTFLSKQRRDMIPEKWVSKIIVWYTDLLNDVSFTDFLLMVYPIETENWKKFWNIYKKQYWDTEFLQEFQDEIFIRQEKKAIASRLEEIKLEQNKQKIKKFDLSKNSV